jgi:hypothetical protein
MGEAVVNELTNLRREAVAPLEQPASPLRKVR